VKLRIVLAIAVAAAALSCLSFQPGPQVLGPYSAAQNFTIDMAGTPDTRPGTWGNAQAYPIRIPFHPPSGYRVRILRVYGDFVAFPTTGTIQPGTYSEVSWGFLSTAPGGSTRADLSADDCFLWLQSVLTAQNGMIRMAFDHDTHIGGLLEPDNVLILQLAVSLNTTGLQVHEEPTYVIVWDEELYDSSSTSSSNKR
jgi:hypothetical protein